MRYAEEDPYSLDLECKRGNTYLSRPQYPAILQARIRPIESVNRIGLMLTVPASMKLRFIRAPKNAATLTTAPTMSPIPTSTSPTAIAFDHATG